MSNPPPVRGRRTSPARQRVKPPQGQCPPLTAPSDLPVSNVTLVRQPASPAPAPAIETRGPGMFRNVGGPSIEPPTEQLRATTISEGDAPQRGGNEGARGASRQRPLKSVTRPSTRGERPYACDECDYRASQRSNLVKHMNTHTGERPYACDECDYRASQRSNLLKHMNTHTGERPYACDECDYRASQRSNLLKHMNTHTGERPYACDECDYRASQRSNLVKHMNTHTGKRPYACGECDYKASQRSNLVKHMYTHTGERPYACDECDYRASQRSNLVKHMNTHRELTLSNTPPVRLRRTSPARQRAKPPQGQCPPLTAPSDLPVSNVTLVRQPASPAPAPDIETRGPGMFRGPSIEPPTEQLRATTISEDLLPPDSEPAEPCATSSNNKCKSSKDHGSPGFSPSFLALIMFGMICFILILMFMVSFHLERRSRAWSS